MVTETCAKQKPEGGGEAASIQQPALEPAALNEASNWPRHNQAAAVSHCIVSQAAPSGCPPPAAAGNGDFTAHLPGLDPAPKPAKVLINSADMQSRPKRPLHPVML